MPVKYSVKAKTSRMDTVRALVDGGSLVLFDHGNRLVSFRLPRPAGEAMAGILYFRGFPMIAAAEANGVANNAQLFSAIGETVCSGLTVGKGKDSDIELDNVDISIGNLVKLEAVELRHF